MKKFLLKVSIFAAFAFFVQVIIPVYVDPFNVFHWDNIRANGVEPNKNYVKMKYILANPGKYDSFLFGSSRVGFIPNKDIKGVNCYNMNYPVGLPGWHLLNIKTFLKNGIHPKKIYIGFDSFSYTVKYERQINTAGRCPYEYLDDYDDIFHFMKLYLDPAMVYRSLPTIIDGWRGRIYIPDPEVFYKYGWGNRIVDIHRKYDWSRAVPSIGHDKPDIDSALKFIRETVNLCHENNIELTLFTNPIHRITYLVSVRDKDYFSFLEGLAEISDFWNFSSLSDITLSNDNFYENSHYRAEIGEMIVDIMCSGKSYPELQRQGFGVKVTRENARDFISMLRKQLDDYEKSHQ